MELNREQIIKALECCKTPLAEDCENCSYTGKRLEDGVYEGCVNCLVGDALSLINELTEQKAEIWEERNRIYNDLQDWKEIAEGYQKQFEDCAEDRAKLSEENERLRADNEIKSQKRANIFEIANAFERGRTDGVRKMQERLSLEFDRMHKSNFMTPEVRQWIIDQIAKEMLEGIKNE